MWELKFKETETGYTVNEWEVALEPKMDWFQSLYLTVFYLQPIPKEKTKWTRWVHQAGYRMEKGIEIGPIVCL